LTLRQTEAALLVSMIRRVSSIPAAYARLRWMAE
jgi:hypothetical protein